MRRVVCCEMASATDTALELVAEAKKASDEALKVPVLTMAVQADEFRDLRARCDCCGQRAGRCRRSAEVLANILKGRLEDLHGWALFNQEKYHGSDHSSETGGGNPAGGNSCMANCALASRRRARAIRRKGTGARVLTSRAIAVDQLSLFVAR